MKIDGRGESRYRGFVLLGGLLLLGPGFWAGEKAMADRIIYECVEPGTGERSLRDICRPGMGSREWKKLYTPGEEKLNLDQLAKERPIEIYTVQGCESCDLIRNYLRRQSIPYQEKDVTSEDPANTSKESIDKILALQVELKSRSGGLTVPAIFIGGGGETPATPILGFNLPRLKDALEEAGYPVGEKAATE